MRAAGKLFFIGAGVEVLSLTGCGVRVHTACGFCTSGCVECTVERTSSGSSGGDTSGGSSGPGWSYEAEKRKNCVHNTFCQQQSMSNGH